MIHQPVANPHRAPGAGGHVRVVGDDDDGDALAVQLLEQIEDLLAGVGVQRAGRLVGQDDIRPVDQGAGDGDALLLAAGEFVGAVVGAVAQADALQRRAGAAQALLAGQPGVHQRQGDLFDSRGARQQVELLEDEADAAAADARLGVVGQLTDVFAA